ncbi:hypothetical protein BU23DRAFT_599923 [Bimuria novae-zelandiae CBS 107.79]|uniref:Uncharacterized protein n=1 Tax=Bimuria novae-zelandiae CBS 107.79 TaxID=1447943 RepID=A0A6A5VFF7_9PLEO|nr:hypothetical protein BU23DRAFT_599923 [Bimuria novae-zelandiae CBS 107.79]
MLLHWLFPSGQDAANASLAEMRAAALREKQDIEGGSSSEEAIAAEGAGCDEKTTELGSEALSGEFTVLWPSSPVSKRAVDHGAASADDDIPRAASAPPTPQSFDTAAASVNFFFNEENNPWQDRDQDSADSDTLVVQLGQPYLEYNNGNLPRAPILGVSHTGELCRQEPSNTLSVTNLKRKFDAATESLTDELSSRINAATAGLDIPALAGCVTDPIFRLPNKLSAIGKACKRGYQYVDNNASKPEFLEKRKRRRSNQGEGDYEFMTGMKDAHRKFAHEMAARVREALEEQGICEGWIVGYFRAELERVLERFYLENIDAAIDVTEIMTAEPRWTAGEDCFELELEALWAMPGDPHFANFRAEPVGFALPETLCKVGAEEYRRRSTANATDDVNISTYTTTT